MEAVFEKRLAIDQQKYFRLDQQFEEYRLKSEETIHKAKDKNA